MMDKPTLAEIITAAREFLENKAMPELTGRTAFHARVAANALAIAEREITIGPAAAEAEHARLTLLLNRHGTLEELNAALCARISSGDMDLDTPGLAEHLRLTTIDKVRIDQPNYSGLKTALAREDRGAAV
ncbi:MAG: hypothetical protein IT548_14710 [Alphaproteobacteria bacterium]|nr:hypothetical protein [Alphaproteobacteria bacterium]